MSGNVGKKALRRYLWQYNNRYMALVAVAGAANAFCSTPRSSSCLSRQHWCSQPDIPTCPLTKGSLPETDVARVMHVNQRICWILKRSIFLTTWVWQSRGVVSCIFDCTFRAPGYESVEVVFLCRSTSVMKSSSAVCYEICDARSHFSGVRTSSG